MIITVGDVAAVASLVLANHQSGVIKFAAGFSCSDHRFESTIQNPESRMLHNAQATTTMTKSKDLSRSIEIHVLSIRWGPQFDRFECEMPSI